MTETRPTADAGRLRGAMAGMGMIFDETYRPFFERMHGGPLYDERFGACRVELAAVASRTGERAEAYRRRAAGRIGDFASFREPGGVEQLVKSDVDFLCVATPDQRHFEAARAALDARKHVLIEKPSVLTLQELDELQQLAVERGVLAKVVYHKLLDPDHKKLRTLVVDGQLRHVNSGYCTLLEPKQISGQQFAEWIQGRNPGTYVAVHYIKLIDFTFGLDVASVASTGQRGLVGPPDGSTWDSTQLRIVARDGGGREAAFDIHTSWVTPDNFPGYVDQEVQFRFDNGIWNAHQRRRGVECTIEDRTPRDVKININNHYNAACLEPDGERTERGYGVEVLERFAAEVALVEFGGPRAERDARLEQVRRLDYNDLAADRQTVGVVQAMEAILAEHAAGRPDGVVRFDDPRGGLVLYVPGQREPRVLYEGRVRR